MKYFVCKKCICIYIYLYIPLFKKILLLFILYINKVIVGRYIDKIIKLLDLWFNVIYVICIMWYMYLLRHNENLDS